MRHGVTAALLIVLLAACSSAPEAPPPTVPPASAEAPAVEPMATPGTSNTRSAGAAAGASRLLGGRTIRVQPARPLNLQAQCAFRNETGYHGTASVEVANGQVKRLSAVFNVPEKGQCVMDLSRMRQTRSMPSVELRDTRTGCTARMWEQGNKATVSFTDCASYCSHPEAFKYVWPILIERPSGRCE